MKLSARVSAVSAAVAISAVSLVAMLPASAASVDIESNLTGALTVKLGSGEELALGVPAGSKFVGTLDDATGGLTGNVTIASGTVPITSPAAGTLAFSMIEDGQAVGTIAADNTVTFTDSQSLRLDSIDLGTGPVAFPETCKFGPIAMTYTGTYDPDTGVIKVTSNTVNVPRLATDACGAFTAIIQDLLNQSTVKASLEFTAAVEVIEPPVTTEAPVTTMAPATTAPATTAPATTMPAAPRAHAARPVAATPKYTG